MTLFEISENYKKNLFDLESLYEYKDSIEDIEENQDRIIQIEKEIEELINSIDTIDNDLSVKFDNYVNIIKAEEMDNLAIDKEIKRLQKLKKRNLNLITRLKYFMMFNLKNIGKTVYKVFLNTISIRKNNPAVNIIDEDAIPYEYKEEIIKEKILKTKIKNDIKNNIDVPGCELTRSERIDIK